MSKLNCTRKGCKDVFHAFLAKNATYDGLFEFPCIKPTYEIPNRLISFSKAISSKDYEQWVHFYEDDYRIERFWRHPKKYLHILKKFKGVILPDFSVYRDMPFSMQIWNIYRSRILGHWLQEHGILVIPNIRYGDKRTFFCSCDGISQKCVIAIGTHGTLKNREDRDIFIAGLEVVVNRLCPKAIIVYGAAPENIFGKYKKAGICIYQFNSDFATSRKEVV